MLSCLAILFLSSLVFTDAFVPSARRTAVRSQPLYENFGLDIGESPEENTLQRIYGEVNYKNFVGSYNDDALLLGGKQYNIIEAIRVNKLLSVTVDSGLLEALESKGITLSQIEKLLPIADNLGVLSLVKNNKNLLLSLAPLLIEPAPLLLPILASVLKTPAANFQFAGLALLGAGGFELVSNNALLAVPLLLLGVPLGGLGAVLGSLGGAISSLPSATSYSTGSAGSASGGKGVKAVRGKATKTLRLKNTNAVGGDQNGRRRLIKIK